MEETAKKLINYSLTRQFLFGLLKNDVARFALAPRDNSCNGNDPCRCDIEYMTADGAIGFIKQLKIGMVTVYKIIYKNKTVVSLSEKEYEIIRPFNALTFNGYIKRLELLECLYAEYKDTVTVRSEMLGYLKIVMIHFQTMFHDGTFEKLDPISVGNAKMVEFKNAELFGLMENVLFMRDNDNNLLKFTISLN